MAIGTHFIVYERAVGAGPRDGGAAIGKWRDEEAGHNSMVPGGGIWWHYGHTVTYLHAIYSSTPRWWTDTAMLYVLFVNHIIEHGRHISSYSGKFLVYAGIIDIGIEYCGTVCSQHHTVWEDPLSLRGAKLLFTLVSLLVSAVG